MQVNKNPSKWWQFEQRVGIAWRNRKHKIIKTAMSDGNKLAIGATVLGLAATATSYVPVLGSWFVSPILSLFTLAVGFGAARQYSYALYNDRMDKSIQKKIENYKKRPTPSYMAKFFGNTLKYTVGTARITAGLTAVAGVVTATAAGIIAFGSTALAGSSILSVATTALTVATTAIGIANPIAMLAIGAVAASIGGIGAIKGNKIVTNIGKKLQKSAQLSEQGRKINAGIISRISSGVTTSMKEFGADIFNVAAEKQAKAVKKKIQNKIDNPQKPKI